MKIFSPIISMLNKMSYGRKFLIIGSILIVPLILISVFYLTALNDEIKQIDKRVEGANFNLLLKDALQYTQQTRALNVTLLSDSTVKEKLQETTQKVDQAFQNLDKQTSEMEYDFSTEQQLQDIKQQWTTLKQTKWESAEDILMQYGMVTEEILQLMESVSNNSDLLLADSKESFNLIYNASIDLPSLTEQFGQIRALGVSFINSTEGKEQKMEEINKVYFPTQSSIEHMKQTAAIIFNNKEMNTKLQASFEQMQQDTNTYIAAIEGLENMKLTSAQYYDVATTAINANFNFYTASLQLATDTLEQQYDDMKTKSIIIVIVMVLILILVMFSFMGLYIAIRQSIGKLQDGATNVANGNLNVKVALHTKDEMQNIEVAFNKMTEQLTELVGEITSSAEHVAASSEQLNASAQEATASVEQATISVNQMATETEQQLVSLNESTEAIDEMVIGIEKIAENSVKVSSLTNDTTNFANDGHLTVEKALEQMHTIKQTAENSSNTIHTLNAQSTKISSIVQAITDIANQTNLLALNAAIEAARAGEHGKGFAVVADEVGKLAEQSRQSAQEIAELIHVVQADTMQSVKMMASVTDNVEVGISITEEAASKFTRILSSMQVLNPQMEEISSTATQFSAQAEQIAVAMEQLVVLTRHTGEASEEIAASSEEQLAIMEEVSSSATSLSEMAESLSNLVTKFKL